MRFLLLVVASLFLASCATSYSILDFKQHAFKAEKSYEASMQTLNTDYLKKQKVVQSFKSSRVDIKKFPYNRLLNIFSELSDVYEGLAQQKNVIKQSKKSVSDIFSEKQNVKKNDPEFKLLKKYSRNFLNVSSDMQKGYDNYRELSYEFSRIARASEISLVDIQRHNSSVQNIIRETSRDIRTAEQEFNKNKRLIKKYPKNIQIKNGPKLLRIKEILTSLKHEASAVKKTGYMYKAAFKKESGDVVIGPHLKTYQTLQELQMQQREFKHSMADFEKQSKDLEL